uniref:Integrin, alpha 3a n=1 Tax=Sinocyclocheilus rhinocerous TaxID=307959 RepID=A0A673NND2_9TELE
DPDKVLFLCALFLAARCCQAFNLDVRFVVAKEGKTDGSLFGLSVALHEQVVGEKRHLLLVGAPKEKAESGVSANETGDVYACPITADTKDCRRLNLLNSNPKNDVMDGMWLGVSIASQSQPGGRVLAWGHRYVQNFATNFRMIGRCYIRGNDLQYNTADSQWQSYSEVCDPRDDQTSEGMCLAGMSNDVKFPSNNFPSYAGNTFSLWYNPEDKGNIYIGYSIAVAQDVLSKDKDTMVTGAPRDEARGSVTMAEVFKASVSGEVKIKATVVGEQVGSYFGSSVAIVDLNNDGWKDLIVGAPFYFDRRNDEGGALYVYMNQNGSFRDKADVVLTGPKDSAFGMAVVAIGDVNQDGFQDFAVGAPYHSKGRVYIWMGNKTGISQMPSQVIDGKDIPGGGFQTFGYSISGGMDVDRNSYPDIAVGSLDDRVVLLRARPVIHLNNSFTVTPSVISPEDCDICITLIYCLYKVAPIVFLLSVTLVEPVPSGRQTLEDLSAFPVISQRYALTGRAEIHIQKACGSDNKCESNLQMTAAFTDEQNTQNGFQIFHYTTDVKKLKLMVNVSSVKSQDRKAEDVYGALLNVTIPTSLSFSSLNPKVKSIDVLRNCTLVPSTVEIEITFETAEITIDMQEIQTELQLSTPFSEFRTEYSGKVVGESAMESTSDIGSPVEFNLTVALSGKPLGNLGFLEVVFQWPYAVANQKWLLYLSEIQMAGTSKQFCVPENNAVNPLNLTVSDWFCGTGSALCQTFTCPLLGMDTSANLTVRARVWNSTMLEVRAPFSFETPHQHLITAGLLHARLSRINPTLFTVAIDPAEAEELQYEVPLWIIIVSVLAGVILLGLIVILLWKCGFFKRANTRELYEAKAQKAEMKTQPSENDRLTEED